MHRRGQLVIGVLGLALLLSGCGTADQTVALAASHVKKPLAIKASPSQGRESLSQDYDWLVRQAGVSFSGPTQLGADVPRQDHLNATVNYKGSGYTLQLALSRTAHATAEGSSSPVGDHFATISSNPLPTASGSTLATLGSYSLFGPAGVPSLSGGEPVTIKGVDTTVTRLPHGLMTWAEGSWRFVIQGNTLKKEEQEAKAMYDATQKTALPSGTGLAVSANGTTIVDWVHGGRLNMIAGASATGVVAMASSWHLYPSVPTSG